LPPLRETWPAGYPPHEPVTPSVARDADRRAERDHGIPTRALMTHASMGLAALAARMAGPRGRILVVCGPGSNGGDGYGAARFLHSWRRRVHVVAVGGAPPHGDAADERRLAKEAGLVEDAADPARALGELDADVVLDALFGTGLSRPLAEPFVAWIEAMNRADALRLAADVPSGLDAEDGREVPLAVRADVTATMGLPKTGLYRGRGPALAGRVVEIDIGLPAALHLEHARSAARRAARPSES
jgi:NAD(P)H-hydrate epimerase